ncbi:uncharacterized protein B0I36DRAFT_401378 [Microdochium trichocladiopsis]|uniref:Subtilisin-like serine protease n=1 Tax=Microdochium trichocladiopsis TaxID=1682393 RepID=A0A9P8XRU8_9PEZI|nr:uncharacterized protein B0I36DRAFT_401378 [Microdochium trichocladiopsis]KAH7010640.1 hypothetical protein B0I36DRAFT_401378 [Microdochium trichocladiopsis]
MAVPKSSAPFTHRALEHDTAAGKVAAGRVETSLVDLLPASSRTPADDLTTPAHSPVVACVDAELDLRRLADVHDWLWIAGRPMPPRPLHQQRLLNREILITERLDQHLVWGTGRMFFKPLPRFLLEPRFWEEHLRCPQPPSRIAGEQRCACGGRRERALGLLFSYAGLIAHESDFHIAKENHLLPQEVQWQSWRTVVKEVLGTQHIYSSIDPRFHYGELRLSRLNKIYFLWKTPLRRYMSRWTQYGSFFGDNFAWLASSTVYIAIVLTVMQVGLATELQNNEAFQSASYGFTVFSILGPLVAAGLILVVFFYMFVDNWVATRRYQRKRMQIIKTQG